MIRLRSGTRLRRSERKGSRKDAKTQRTARNMQTYPDAFDPEKVGEYSASAHAGGGFVWDEVLEYRVWCHTDGDDDFVYAFATFAEAQQCFLDTPGADEPVALILQREYIDEPEAGHYVHVVKERIAEWPPEFLQRPKRTPFTIPDFLAPNAPENRLEIIRGLPSNPREGFS